MSGGWGILAGTGLRQYARRTSGDVDDLRDYVHNLASKSLQMDSSGNVDIFGIINIASAGELRQGSGALGTDFTGLRIWTDSGIGRIGGYASDVLQWYANTDGKLYAGAGKVILDSAGIRIVGGTTTGTIGIDPVTPLNQLTFVQSLNSGGLGNIAKTNATTENQITLWAESANFTNTKLRMGLWAGASWDAYIQIIGTGGTISGEMNLGGGTFTFLSEVVINDSYKLSWSDVNLYRSAANMLKTDDSLTIAVGLNVGSATSGGSGDVAYSADLEPLRGGVAYTGYVFVPLTTPLTSTAFDGDSFSDTAATAINLQLAVGSGGFGAPAGIKAVAVRIRARDSGSAAETSCYVALGPTETAFYALQLDLGGVANDAYHSVSGVVPCDSNGDIWYSVGASGASTMDVTIDIWGYWI